MRSLGDEIAVLDGLGDSMTPGYQSRKNVIDPSDGGNYGGGSDYYPGSPLTPSNSGLADADDDLMRGYASRVNVIDPSAGANYGGGSDYYPGGPLTPSNAGLAGCYDGCDLNAIDGQYGSTMEAAFMPQASTPGYTSRVNVIDPSGGANYGGGSDYYPGGPLTPSNAGLAGLDGLSDDFFQKQLMPNQVPAFKRVASQGQLLKLKRLAKELSSTRSMTPFTKLQLQRVNAALSQARGVRRNIVNKVRQARRAA